MESPKGTEAPEQNTRKSKMLQCERSPFKSKIQWQFNYIEPVIRNVMLENRMKEDNCPTLPKKGCETKSHKSNYVFPQKKKQASKSKETPRFETETKYMRDYVPYKIEKELPSIVSKVITKGIIPRLPPFGPDPHSKKSHTTVELEKVAARWIRTGRLPCRPAKDVIEDSTTSALLKIAASKRPEDPEDEATDYTKEPEVSSCCKGYGKPSNVET